MKWKEKDWVVFVSCLIEEQPVEGQPRSFKVVNAGRLEQAHTAEKASWKAVKTIWEEAAKRNEIQPICGVRVLEKEEYEQAEKKFLEQLEKEKETGGNEENKEAETPAEPYGQTETESGNKDNVGEQEGRTSRV